MKKFWMTLVGMLCMLAMLVCLVTACGKKEEETGDESAENPPPQADVPGEDTPVITGTDNEVNISDLLNN